MSLYQSADRAMNDTVDSKDSTKKYESFQDFDKRYGADNIIHRSSFNIY